MRLAERAAVLGRHILAPLVLGGAVRPVRPFGPKLVIELGELGVGIDDDELRLDVDLARVRQARRLVPVDVLPDMGGAEWSLAAALNDLLQATNHLLSGPATRGRHDALLAGVHAACALVPRPADLLAALVRHATFARAIELCRRDTRVSWWVGSAGFRGEKPPARLLSWPNLRRVRVERRTVLLADMARGVPASAGAYARALGAWLSCTPLTDLAWADRPSPAFAWTANSLSLVSTVEGRNLALRAVARRQPPPERREKAPAPRTRAALEAATAALPAASAARDAAEAFLRDIAS
ncbi:MAG: hypothetical protein HY744_22355 [Deltaproteobacteria bacterium]|nr:hypothetical protein [Deltaproteobacteria bacterium]